MVAGNAVEEDRLPGRIGEEVGRKSHLFQRRTRPAHRYQLPANTGLGNHSRLSHVLRVVTIDCSQRHDGLDALTFND